MATIDGEDPTLPQDLLEAVNVLEACASISSNTSTLSGLEWETIVTSGRKIANGLREATLRTSLGKTSLISSCGVLLACGGITTEERLAQTELLRIIGNVCFDHDENRALSHSAVLPSLLAVLSSVIGLGKQLKEESEPVQLSIAALTLVRAGVGALLNMSLKYDPVREVLMNADTISILLTLLDSRTNSSKSSTPIYVVGSWAVASSEMREDWETRIQMGSMILTWAVNILEDLLSGDKLFFPESGVAALASVILTSPPIIDTSLPPTWDDQEETADFLETDLHLLTTCSSLLEALSIDLESAKQEIAFSNYTYSTSSSSSSSTPSTTSLLSHLFVFIETASPPSHWSTSTSDPEFGIKVFSTIKSAVVRSVIEAPNSDFVMDKIFEDGKLEVGGKSWIVKKLVGWMEEEKVGREDLLILGSHMLAALGRKDEYCLALVQEYGLEKPLSKLVKEKAKQQFMKGDARPGEVTQILFGVVSLLRHLAIPAANKERLGEGDIIESVSALLVSEIDIVGPLQASVVGLLKQLTVSNLSNSVRFVTSLVPTPPSITAPITTIPPPEFTPLEYILSLILRTDDVRLRSESTRILVNVVRTLFSTKPISTNTDFISASPITPIGIFTSSVVNLDEVEIQRRKGKPKIVRIEVVQALSELIRLSEKYPMLINEGIVALTLLAGSGTIGATLVLDALLKVHSVSSISPVEELETEPITSVSKTELSPIPSPSPSTSKPPPPRRATSLAVSPLGDPSTSLGMLITWLGQAASSSSLASTSSTTLSTKLSNGPGILQVGMINNLCALLITVIRGNQLVVVKEEEEVDLLLVVNQKLNSIKKEIVGPLEGILLSFSKNDDDLDGGLKLIIERLLEVCC